MSPVRPFLPVAPGDRVAVVAPSSPIRQEMLDEGLGELRRLGFEPVMRGDIDSRHRFSAGTKARRLEELIWALEDSETKAVWCARGGYGLTPLLDGLPGELLRSCSKPIIGESDVTALGCAMLAHGRAWLHGPMVASALRAGEAGYDAASLLSGLRRERPLALSPEGTKAIAPGQAEGVLWGGCLTLLAALAGTRWLPRIPRGVLLVEDVGVKPYQVHRMLVQLRDVGALDGLAGVVLGDFSSCVQHADQGYDIHQVLGEFFSEVAGEIPVSAGWPVGHAGAPHLTLTLGMPATLVVPEEGSATLTCGSPSESADSRSAC